MDISSLTEKVNRITTFYIIYNLTVHKSFIGLNAATRMFCCWMFLKMTYNMKICTCIANDKSFILKTASDEEKDKNS